MVADVEVGPHLELGALESELTKDLPDEGEPLIVDPIDPSENLRFALRPRPEGEIELPEVLLPDHPGGPQQAIRGRKNGKFNVRGHHPRELILPVLEYLLLKIIAVFEVPVEAALRDVEVASEPLHPNSFDPFFFEHLERCFEPVGLLFPGPVPLGRHEIMLANHVWGIQSQFCTVTYKNLDGGVQNYGTVRREERRWLQGRSGSIADRPSPIDSVS